MATSTIQGIKVGTPTDVLGSLVITLHKVGNIGQISIEGSAPLANNSVMCRLPIGFRPIASLHVNDANTLPNRIICATDGTVKYVTSGSGSAPRAYFTYIIGG